MLKISLFIPTVKICDHSLYTQIAIKNFLLFIFTQYKNGWKERKFWRQNNRKKVTFT